jgi:predicted ATPase
MQTSDLPFYIFTGGPGVGKSTTLDALKKRGYQTFPESARHFKQYANLGRHEAHPKKNLSLFRDKILQKDLDFYNKALLTPNDVSFFDRGIIDLLAFDHQYPTPHIQEVSKLAQKIRYNKNVFFFPPWEEIFMNDPEREESFEKSVEIAELLTKIYTSYDYKLFEVPKMGVDERVDWILNKISI